MYYFPIIINKRKVHICPLQLNGQKKVIHSFVLELGEKATLLSFKKDIHKIISEKGTKDDRDFYWDDVQFSWEKNNLLKITIESSEEETAKKSLDDSLITNGFSIQEQETSFDIIYENKINLEKINVQINIIVDGKNYSNELVLCLAPKAQIYDVILDFGSEASQLVIYHRGSATHKLLRTKIIEAFEDHFFGSLETNDTYNQTDPNDPELFRSVFFIQEKGGNINIDGEPNNTPNPIIKLLTNSRDTETLQKTHFILSNLKLAQMGNLMPTKRITYFDHSNTNEATQPLNDIVPAIYQTVINRFLHLIMKEIQVAQNAPKNYINLKLLVPNIFPQARISSIIEQTYKSIAQIQLENQDYNIQSVEVNTLSESDASFLGYLHQQALTKGVLFPNKRCLIIDVGKGTTDFSFIKQTEVNTATSLYRSGFVGAGNYLTFGFVDAFIAALVGDSVEKRKAFLQKQFYDKAADIQSKLKFMALVEQLKCNYSNSKERGTLISIDELRNALHADDEHFDTILLKTINERLTDLVKGGCSIDDYKGIISNTTKALAQRLKTKIHEAYIEDYEEILLAGRGFLFQPFLEAVKAIFDGKKITYIENPKQVCLLGAAGNQIINHNANLIGLPFIRSVIPSEDGNIFQFKLGGKLGVIIKKTEDFVKKTENIFTQISQKKLEQEQTLINEAFFFKGRNNKYQSSYDHFLVSGHLYKFATPLNTKSKDINIFFTGKEFLVRSAKDSAALRLRANLPNSRLAFETLFPFNEWDDKKFNLMTTTLPPKKQAPKKAPKKPRKLPPMDFD